MRQSAETAVFTAEAAAVAVVAMAKVASNTSKAMEAADRAQERPGDLVYASPAESLAIGHRTAKQAL